MRFWWSECAPWLEDRRRAQTIMFCESVSKVPVVRQKWILEENRTGLKTSDGTRIF